MSDSIVLPRSGVVLPDSAYGIDSGDWAGWRLSVGYDRDGQYMATGPNGARKYGSRDECIAWLDAAVLAARAALLPPGALLVPDDAETRERIAEALGAYSPNPLWTDESWKAWNRTVADAVLAALRRSR